VRRADYDCFLVFLTSFVIVYLLFDNMLIAGFFTDHRPTLTWLIFVLTWLVAIGLVNIAFIIYIFVPVGRWFFQSVNVYLTISLVIFYALILMAACYLFTASSEPFVRFARPIFNKNNKKFK